MKVTDDKKTLNEEALNSINPASKEDILELSNKIQDFRNLQIDEDKFRSYRLARGVYGQRQEGVQMIRIKLPYGRVTPEQLVRIADISDKYASHNLHATTRQDIQIHYVKLEDSPKVWLELEEKGVTLKEACGNTVRNVTASAEAGVDPGEPFDVTPYAHACFSYFLRNPICQEMGRKFKISWSSSDSDTAFSFMHDLGFIPKIKDGQRGFKIMIGGGLGAQDMHAHVAHEFLHEDEVIPFAEAVIRVFDRYGERSKRNKARMKFLIKQLGLEEFMKLVEEQRTALKSKTFKIDTTVVSEGEPNANANIPNEKPADQRKFDEFVKTNVFEQKQKGYYGVYVRVILGDLSSDTAREFADIVSKYASEDIRVTVNQGYLLRFVKEEALPVLHNELDKLGLGEPGFDSTADITACPGTDTCNLGISSSTGTAAELEKVIKEEYPELIYNNDIKIKISGCMNACGQHNIASIGFHGMSMKKGPYVLPAMQVLLGGGIGKDGKGYLGDKIIKVPSKRTPEALRLVLDDYSEKSKDGEYFRGYYERMVEADKFYFFNMLKPLADLESLTELDFIDWGHTDKYVKEIGVGECAGVILDLVGTLINETEEKFTWAEKALDNGVYADAVYNAYNVFVGGAKALLTAENVNTNTQIKIISDFDEHMVDTGAVDLGGESFTEKVLKMNKHEPTEEFARSYVEEAKAFLQLVKAVRKQQVAEETK